MHLEGLVSYTPQQSARTASGAPSPENEQSMVMRAVKHDQQAFARLYDRFVDKIYRYIFFRVGSAAIAEDLTAQVFLKAWSNIGSYRYTKRPFAAWLYRIAHNVTIDHIRASHATLSIEHMELRDEKAKDLDELAQEHLTAQTLRSAIGELTKSQQQVITLKFLEGYSTVEIADLMRKDPSAVRALQHRALGALQCNLHSHREMELNS